jgi:putative flippase GtrA
LVGNKWVQILDAYRRLPENIRLVLTAILGAGIGYIIYELIYYLNPIEQKASSSWFIAFIIGVLRQHALHRWLTFNHKSPYWRSLLRAYIMYSGSLFATSCFNFLLTEVWELNHRLAWGCCLILQALIGLIFLKRYVFRF